MKNRPWKAMSTLGIVASLLVATGCTQKQITSEEKQDVNYSASVTNYNFDTAGNMLAYAEFELSGEPLAEALGLDLDLLDPQKVNKPTAFDYTAGVESYEYSEEAMYELVEKSGLGLHLINGPIVDKMAKESGKQAPQALEERFYQLAESVGYDKGEIFRNMYPTFMEYSKGDPHYIQKVDTSAYAESDDKTYTPVYQVDFKTLRWDRDKMDKILMPAAYGGAFLKQALWAGDFLSGFHTVDKDEELEAEAPNQDKDANIRLGVSAADGFQGVILTEEIWNKLAYIRDGLFYDANTKQLVKGSGTQYDPANGFVYLPHAIKVTEEGQDVAKASNLEVSDSRSFLRDQWMMLWPASEFYGMTDQRQENKNVNPAFRAAFDGVPFAAAPQENTDAATNNDVIAYDAYSLNRDVLLQVFKNLQAMHFNKEVGAFINIHDGQKQGDYVDAFEAGYTLEALRIFQRAIDGLPVGYASGEDAQGLQTEEGKLALDMMKKQADFMIEKMMTKDGLIVNGFTIGKGPDEKAATLEAQLGAVRGLTATYLATKKEKYREAARTIYNAVDTKMWDKKLKVYKTEGDSMKYTPYTAASISAAFRLALLNLGNMESDKQQYSSLEKETVVSRYMDFYDRIIDGPSLKEGMQVSEFWDTGDSYKKGDKTGNTDKDNVPQVQAGHGKYGIAPILVDIEVKNKN
jgi:hypothetical protein